MDVWGPYSRPSLSDKSYFLTIVDDFSRMTWTFLMKHKHVVFVSMPNFYAYVQTQFSVNIKCIRSDNGTEFTLSKFFAKNGIMHHLTCVATLQENVVVKREHQHLLTVARSLLF